METGSRFQSEKFGEYEVVALLPNSRVSIKFLSTGYAYECYKSQAKSGQVKDLMAKTVCGIGFVGGTEYNWTKDRKAYDAWCNMLKRCYNTKRLQARPSYAGCTVDERWHNFQTFAKWYYIHVLNIPCHLDKDLLKKDNKVYSPNNCCILPTEVNIALLGGKSSDKSCGVFYRKKDNIFVAQINRNNTLEYLGCYKDEGTAKAVYIKAKKGWLAELAEKYANVLSVKAYEALHQWTPT